MGSFLLPCSTTRRYTYMLHTDSSTYVHTHTHRYIYICLSRWHMKSICSYAYCNIGQRVPMMVWGMNFLNIAVFFERKSFWIWIMTWVLPCRESKVSRWFAQLCYAVWVCHKVRDAEGWSERSTPMSHDVIGLIGCSIWLLGSQIWGPRRSPKRSYRR